MRRTIVNEDALVITGFCFSDADEGTSLGLRFPWLIDCGPVQGFPESLARNQEASVLIAMGQTIPGTYSWRTRDATFTCTGVDCSVAAPSTPILRYFHPAN